MLRARSSLLSPIQALICAQSRRLLALLPRGDSLHAPLAPSPRAKLGSELAAAIESGDLGSARRLLLRGAPIEGSWRPGEPSAMEAACWARSGSVTLIETLRLSGVNPLAPHPSPQRGSSTPFESCLRAGNWAGALRLMELGAPATAQALRWACLGAGFSGGPSAPEDAAALRSVFDLLRPAALDGPKPLSLNSLLALASPNLEAIRTLLEFGANPAEPGPESAAALARACHFLQLDSALALLAAGADPNALDAQGRAPLENAALGTLRLARNSAPPSDDTPVEGAALIGARSLEARRALCSALLSLGALPEGAASITDPARREALGLPPRALAPAIGLFAPASAERIKERLAASRTQAQAQTTEREPAERSERQRSL